MKTGLIVLMFFGVSAHAAEKFSSGLNFVTCDSICRVFESQKTRELKFKQISKSQGKTVSKITFYDKNYTKSKKIFYAQVEILKTEDSKAKDTTYDIRVRMFPKGRMPEHVWPQYHTTVRSLKAFPVTQISMPPVYEKGKMIIPRLTIGKRIFKSVAHSAADLEFFDEE